MNNHLQEQESIQWGKKNELLWIGLGVIIAGFIAKIPQFQGVREDLFYQRNLSFIFLPLMVIYFIWKQHQSWKKLILPLIFFIFTAIYINLLPDANNTTNQTSELAFFHLPIMFWILLGYVYLGSEFNSYNKGVVFIRFSADLLIMCVIIVLSGFLFMGMTMGLFKLIGIDTAYIIQYYILIWGLPAIPIIATYIIQNNPTVVNKISPIIAKIFTPLVTLMLLLFLFGIIVTGKNPSTDRDFLVVFNGLLVGVMALIIFSLSEMTKKGKQHFQLYNLLSLALITIVLNSIALYAIGVRFFEFGFSANRFAVIGADLLIFLHLILVTNKLYLLYKDQVNIEDVESATGSFIPVYFFWTAIISMVLPIVLK